MGEAMRQPSQNRWEALMTRPRGWSGEVVSTTLKLEPKSNTGPPPGLRASLSAPTGRIHMVAYSCLASAVFAYAYTPRIT